MPVATLLSTITAWDEECVARRRLLFTVPSYTLLSSLQLKKRPNCRARALASGPLAQTFASSLISVLISHVNFVVARKSEARQMGPSTKAWPDWPLTAWRRNAASI